MQIRNNEVFALHAELCKVLSSPMRLMIIDLLGRRDLSVGDIAGQLKANPTTVSQHLRILRDRQIVQTRKQGQSVIYRLAYPRMIEACHIIRSILMDSLQQRGQIAADLAPKGRPARART